METLVFSSAYDGTTCVICNTASGKLIGTDDGRAKIQMAAEQLNDKDVISRINMCTNTFKYHQNPKACYSSYILKSKRSEKTNSEPEPPVDMEEGETGDSYKAPKRRKKSMSSGMGTERKCVPGIVSHLGV